MKGRLIFEKGRNGRGVSLLVHDHSLRESYPVSLSYMDAAEALFQLKDFLQASPTGRDCLTEVHRRRRRAR